MWRLAFPSQDAKTMKTKELFFVFFLFFVFVSFFNCYDLICKWWSQHVRVVGTLGIEGWMKSVSILTFLFFFEMNGLYNHSYFLPIPSTNHRTRVRSDLLNVSLVSPRVRFYTALPVLIVGCYLLSRSSLPCRLYVNYLPQTVPWWPSLCQMVLLFVVSVGVWSNQSSSTPNRCIDSVASD